jgi:hypothetical protein
MRDSITGDKTEIQSVVDLLEGNGYHVFKAEEEVAEKGVCIGNPTGTIQLRIARYRDKED